MRQLTLIVAEPNKAGSEHATFNSAVLQSLESCAKRSGRTLQWFCDPTHRSAILKLAPPMLAQVYWRPITVESGLRRTFVRKFVREISVTVSLLFKARRDRSPIVFLSVFPNVLPFLLLTRRIFREVPVHIFLHGELESLLNPEKQTIRREGFWVKLALFHIFNGRWPFFYVLGAGIRDRLTHLFPQVDALQYIRAFEHPYSFNGRTSHPRPASFKHRVGFVGVGRHVKGIHAFFQLATSLAPYISSGHLEFLLVGGMETGLQPEGAEWVTVLAPYGAGLSADEYQRAISELDCAVFLSTQNYTLTASGSVFDIINEGKEILSLKSNYLTDLSVYDPEGGIKFFDSLKDIETEIRTRLHDGWHHRTFEYPDIRNLHSQQYKDTLMAALFPDSAELSHHKPADF